MQFLTDATSNVFLLLTYLWQFMTSNIICQVLICLLLVPKFFKLFKRIL